MMIKKIGALLLSVVLCIGMAAPAFAFEGEATPVEQPVMPEVVEDVVTVTDETSGALTPEGNLTLVDDYHTDYSDGSGQQFITLVSKSGATFYLVIDRNAKGQQTVHFMNLVDEADLLALMEEDAANEELRRYLVKKDYYSVSILKDYLREVILLQASDSHLLSVLFRQTMEIIGRSIPFEEEPMINLLGWFDNCQWTVCLFPRRTRRPRQFYAEGTEKILFSPGCVDMAGLIISPREEDFRKYSAGLLTDMFSQVTAGPDSWEAIQKELIRL